MTQAYPLAWPTGIPRTEASRRSASQFKTALAPAIKNVTNSLRRFGDTTGKKVTDIVISSNSALGIPSPEDPGIAVWFHWDEQDRCIAVDRYTRLEHNLQAIHHVLEARVTEARHGGLRIVRQTFTGFIALPSPEMFGDRTPGQILGLAGLGRIPTRADIIAAHRDLAQKAHPDRGGDADDMAIVNAARDAMLAALPS